MTTTYEKLLYESFMIGIPSRGRSEKMVKKTGVWKYIDDYEGNVAVVVRNEEVDTYLDARLDARRDMSYSGLGCRIVVVQDESTIAQKRDILIQTAIVQNLEYLFIIDDDVAFYYRDEELSSKYTSKHENFVRMDCFNKILYESMCLCNKDYPIVGLPLKQGSFGLKYMFPKNIPIIRFVCYHVPTLAKERIEATGLGTTFMSDRYVHLTLLAKGYRSLSNCRYCVGDAGTGKPGGCEETRTVELQSEAARLLREVFPDHVTLKYKEDGNWEERRLDCVIKWKKFLDSDEEHYLPKELIMERFL